MVPFIDEFQSLYDISLVLKDQSIPIKYKRQLLGTEVYVNQIKDIGILIKNQKIVKRDRIIILVMAVKYLRLPMIIMALQNLQAFFEVCINSQIQQIQNLYLQIYFEAQEILQEYWALNTRSTNKNYQLNKIQLKLKQKFPLLENLHSEYITQNPNQIHYQFDNLFIQILINFSKFQEEINDQEHIIQKSQIQEQIKYFENSLNLLKSESQICLQQEITEDVIIQKLKDIYIQLKQQPNIEIKDLIFQDEKTHINFIDTISRQIEKKNYLINYSEFIEQDVIRLEESQNIEFKDYSWPFYKTEHIVEAIKKQICAFLNKKGGFIFIGISDDRVVKGITLDNKEKDQLNAFINNLLYLYLPKIDTKNVECIFYPVRKQSLREWSSQKWVVLVQVDPLRERIKEFNQNTLYIYTNPQQKSQIYSYERVGNISKQFESRDIFIELIQRALSSKYESEKDDQEDQILTFAPPNQQGLLWNSKFIER